MSVKKYRKKKKDNLENLVESTQEMLDKLFVLLDEAVSEYKDSNKKDDTIITIQILQEMAEEMDTDHIDFMGMA